MYNLEQLRMFVETVDTGSFSACARKLKKVPSAVSQGVANLEIDLGIELFSRSSRNPYLTVEGKRLLAHARSVLQQMEDMNAVAKGIHQGEETIINIAIEDALITSQFSEILISFSKKFKATTVNVISAASPDIAIMLKEGRADIGIMFLEVEFEKSLTQFFIGNLPFYGVCSPNNTLTENDNISMQDLVPHRQIMLRGQEGRGLDLIPQLSTEVWWTNSFYTIRELVLQDVGWAYLPSSLVDKSINAGLLTKLNLGFDHKPWNLPVELVTPKNPIQGPASTWLSDKLKNLFP